ncbi:hypothetical protein N7457_002545 [Penicillium paradoxum]|uniref:uncharacterized protein n=1 Tax=Penicillium paradoxum TaxID=176176 RepID=UPI0025465D32|nr:uncharacterized protein N7457_002545 [Penicillium paradoxum]KAJ5787555.1 hypothetical protein N7457_002545 [Penicillium paradoxum]
MLTSLLRSFPRLGRRWAPLNFSNPNFARIATSEVIEEETIPGYLAARYYPTQIGEIFKDRYQVVGKLGFGASSTVWLARDMDHRRYVTLKMFIKSTSMGQQLNNELNIYRRIEGASHRHPGYKEFEANELQDPSPRKEIDGRTIYISRQLGFPKSLGAPILCDLGSAVFGDEAHTEDIQPDIYRAPEVILQAPWTYSVDIWNVGCMVWDIFEGGSLFTGQDPEFQTYRSRAHLAEMIRLLGPPPPSLLARGNLTSKFFSKDGFCAGVPIHEHVSLEDRETTLKEHDKERFIHLMRKMLQWEPGTRSSARELEQDEWVQSEIHK